MIKRALGLLMVVTIAVLGFSPLGWAIGNSGNDRRAALSADSPNFEISVYPQPDTKLDRLGYGLAGDEVTILEQMARNRGFSWYRVRFENPSSTEGWIEGKYLTFLNSDRNGSDRGASERYLGNRARSGNSQGNQRP
jgi:hypothetical protein